MADVETTVSAVPDLLVHTGLKLRNAARGVFLDTESSITGAVGSLDFAGETIKRFIVTGDLSGSFATPPSNIPSLELDNQSIILTVIFFQDGTGGRLVPLETLFSNYTQIGDPLVDSTANGATVVDIVARRAAGATTFTVNFSPTFDSVQIVSGTIDAARLPVASGVASGIVMLSPGTGGAAQGDHTHPVLVASRITHRMSDGSTLTNGDFDLLDMPTGGTVVRLTGLKLTGTGTPTATVTAKISGTAVTGTGTSVTETASGDSNATAANTFVARQLLQISIASVAGNPTLLSGWMHYSINTSPWTP